VHIPEAKAAGILLRLDYVRGPARLVVLPEQIDLMNRSLEVGITMVDVKLDSEFAFIEGFPSFLFENMKSYLAVLVMA
jgi:hypothetical protein